MHQPTSTTTQRPTTVDTTGSSGARHCACNSVAFGAEKWRRWPCRRKAKWNWSYVIFCLGRKWIRVGVGSNSNGVGYTYFWKNNFILDYWNGKLRNTYGYIFYYVPVHLADPTRAHGLPKPNHMACWPRPLRPTKNTQHPNAKSLTWPNCLRTKVH